MDQWTTDRLKPGMHPCLVKLKAWHAFMSCEYPENRDVELGKLWAAPVLAPGKMIKWVKAKCTDPSSRHHKCVSFGENQSFFPFHV